MSTRLVDAYGDDIPTEQYVQDDGTVVDAYGDPIAVEQYVVDDENNR